MKTDMNTMSLNLKDYVKIYDNFIDKDLCEKAVEECKNTNWEKHSFYNASTGGYEQFEKELSITYLESQTAKAIQDKMWHALDTYLRKDLCLSWYNSWQGYSRIRFNRYNVDTRMELHCDHIHTLFDGERKGAPIISILGSLNDDYEGGELIMWESETIQLKAGSIMLFPSNYLYPHRVKEVTSGTRYSYVSWAW